MASLSLLPVSALGTAAVRIKELVRATNNNEVIQSSQFMNLETQEQSFLLSYNKMAGSSYTSQITAIDKKRDTALGALYFRVKSELHSPLQAQKEAATEIYSILRAHGTASSIAKQPLGEESQIIRKLLTNLSAQALQPHIVTLSLMVWIDALSTAQNELEVVYARRSDENASEADIASATAQRTSLEMAIRSFMKYLEAMDLISTDPFWHDLSIKVEERIDELTRGI